MAWPRMAGAALLVLLALGTSGCERWRLDRQMELLCQQDGGIKVYETVTLPASEFGPGGEPLFRHRAPGTPREDLLGPEYRYMTSMDILFGKAATTENGQGQLVRWHHAVYRRSDNHLLGESVDYSRSGGDWFTFGFQPGGELCPRLGRDLTKSIFIKG